MRVGDFALELVGRESELREQDSGHVLARPGAVYGIRVRNFGPLRCVVAIEIDGKSVTAGGLVLRPYAVTTLERPIDDGEHGRFTVVAEGDERVFGPDGGRDNPDLGLIEGSFRRELPRAEPPRPLMPSEPFPAIPSRILDIPFAPRPARPPREGPQNRGVVADADFSLSSVQAFHSPSAPPRPEERVRQPDFGDSIERAAGTGLTGRSDQEFTTVSVGPLEAEATTLQLRLVIGSEEALRAPRPLRATADAPARPVARP